MSTINKYPSQRSRLSLTVLGLLTAVALLTVACSSDPNATATDHILELSRSGQLSGEVELEGDTLVRESDAPALLADINAATSLTEKREVISSYLTENKQIDCVVDNLQSSLQEGTSVSCGGKTLVNRKSEHGLPSVKELTENLNELDSDGAKRLYILYHLHSLDGVNRISRVLESVEQIKKSRSIPILGTLVRAIHKFPVVYQGEELVPYSQINYLIEELDEAKIESERWSIVKRELGE